MTVAIAEVGDVYPFFHSSELQSRVDPVMTAVTLGKLTPEAGLAQAQKLGDSILAGGI
jgi:hypothetical protein